MQVSEKDAVYVLPGYLDLIEPLKSTAAGIENELLSTRVRGQERKSATGQLRTLSRQVGTVAREEYLWL